MDMVKTKWRQTGQALIETALFVTFLFFLLAAAFDVGLMFFSYQAIANAALEGATYGSTEPMANGCASCSDANLKLRVRNEPGPNEIVGRSRVKVVDLQDLDSDGAEDTQATFDPRIQVSYILSGYGEQLASQGVPIDNAFCAANRKEIVCDVQVRIIFTYKLFFPLAPAFGKQVQISVVRAQTVH